MLTHLQVDIGVGGEVGGPPELSSGGEHVELMGPVSGEEGVGKH